MPNFINRKKKIKIIKNGNKIVGISKIGKQPWSMASRPDAMDSGVRAGKKRKKKKKGMPWILASVSKKMKFKLQQRLLLYFKFEFFFIFKNRWNILEFRCTRKTSINDYNHKFGPRSIARIQIFFRPVFFYQYFNHIITWCVAGKKIKMFGSDSLIPVQTFDSGHLSRSF